MVTAMSEGPSRERRSCVRQGKDTIAFRHQYLGNGVLGLAGCGTAH